METTCYRCGSAVEDQTSFCPSCGAPQIRVSVPRPYVSERQEVAPPPPPPVRMAPVRVRPANRIDWKAFLRIAAPLAAVVALFSALVPPVGWLILLPGGIILAVHIYRRRAGPLGAWQGARLGACAGLLVFAFSSMIFGVAVSRNPAGYRLEAGKTIQAIKELENRNPEAPHLSQALSDGTRGMVLFTAMSLASLMVFLLVIGGVSGALAASLVRHKSSP